MSRPEFKAHSGLKAQALETTWRQWRALGASTTVQRHAESMVDPEVLVLLSLYLLDEEPRLRDVVTSWVRANSSLLSIQRLRNLVRAYPANVKRRLGALALVGMEAKDARWASIAEGEGATEPLDARTNKRRAVEVTYRGSPTAVLQLRSGMGIGAKADVVAFLCGTWNQGQNWAGVSTISDALGYTPAAIRRVVDELARAKFIKALDTVEHDARRGHRMFSAPVHHWKALLELGTLVDWKYWKEVSLLIIDVIDWAEALGTRSVSGYAMDVEARALIEAHQGVLLRNRILDKHEFASADVDTQYLGAVCDKISMWLANGT